MLRASSAAAALAGRFCRPQRIGVFGHRGVGKTTLLTMLYREAVGGRLPGLRLAAADARTAEYLSDKILLLESGQRLPATLAETDLRFQLYHGNTRLELLVKDYQGEHIALGREEPIREFLRDCDAVWLCLDPEVVKCPADRLRRQQEIEQLIEDYLATEPQRSMDRPIALVVTKADLLGDELPNLEAWTAAHFGMTRHALQAHCPNSGLFAVSSLGRAASDTRGEMLQPVNLAEPLTWLTTALQTQDEARLEQLWALAPQQVALLDRCVACFAQRYPDSEAAALYQQRLRVQQQRKRRRRVLAGLAAAVCLTAGLWAHDVVGQQRLERVESEQADAPAMVLEQWQDYRTWHPTRHLFRVVSVQEEETHMRDLAEQARHRDRDERLAELRRQNDANADPEGLWQQLLLFRRSYPEIAIDGDLQRLQTTLKQRRDDRFNRRAQNAFHEFQLAERRTGDLEALITLANQFLRDFGDSALESKVRERRDAFLSRLDARDIQTARDYSARQPFNFQTRCELYQRYLDRHPADGAYRREATEALKTIQADWDRSDFRSVRDHFLAKPGEVSELVTRCRTYLAIHPQGRFAPAARHLLRWSERVTAEGEYRVVLRSGAFDHGLGRWIGRGMDLSVDLQVNGVHYGPSSIVAKRFDPEWDYEFPRRIRWKLGQPVRIRVTDHKWKDRVVVDIQSEEGDPLAFRLLNGETWWGNNQLVFESDFAMPTLPAIE
jgi:hypothetical protein